MLLELITVIMAAGFMSDSHNDIHFILMMGRLL